jgi:hypothetical protein
LIKGRSSRVLDPHKADVAEAEIDRFIRKRAAERERQEANELEELWRSSERRYQERQQEALRQAWIEHHKRLARNHQSLASEHDCAARKLQEREEV